jgi:exosortase
VIVERVVEELDVSKHAVEIHRSEWVMAALLLLVFAPAVIAMGEVWSTVDYYSHGFLVPVVAYWAATRSRTRFSPLADRDRRGFAVAALATVVYVAGLAMGVVSLQGLGLVAAVSACALYLGGVQGVRVLAFPLAFLVFMVPLPQTWITPTIVQLQLIVSSTAVNLLGWFGSGVARQGNVIQLPAGDELFVAEACSGITSIVTLTPLAVMFAYFTESTLARRIVIVLAVVPAAMLGNLLRVAVTVAAAERYGATAATGNLLHEFAGLITFTLACLALIALGALMKRLAPARS